MFIVLPFAGARYFSIQTNCFSKTTLFRVGRRNRSITAALNLYLKETHGYGFWKSEHLLHYSEVFCQKPWKTEALTYAKRRTDLIMSTENSLLIYDSRIFQIKFPSYGWKQLCKATKRMTDRLQANWVEHLDSHAFGILSGSSCIVAVQGLANLRSSSVCRGLCVRTQLLLQS